MITKLHLGEYGEKSFNIKTKGYKTIDPSFIEGSMHRPYIWLFIVIYHR